MTSKRSAREFRTDSSVLQLKPPTNFQNNQLKKAFVEFVCSVIGRPDYSFTLTLKPVVGTRRLSTKISDAEQAMDWFLHLLNTKCFGHRYRRNKIELGIFATIEGLGIDEKPHWHGAIRLPQGLSIEKFLKAFEHSKNRTKRFGRKWHLEPYYELNWLHYITKTGLESASPRFLRQGTF